MKTWTLVWLILLVLALGGFSLMTFLITVNGYGELRDIFRKLGRRKD